MIAIVGGTGRLGRLVAEALVHEGLAVRLVARSAPADPLPGTTYACADVRHPETLAAALVGADVVVIAAHGMDPAARQSPAAVDRDGACAVVDTAAALGASVVHVSVVGASPDHPLALHRMKWAAEEHLRASGAEWTIVRATAFAETWRDVLARTARGSSGPVMVPGRGANPINFVAVHDVAVAVGRAATDASLRGRVVEVGGPDDLPLDALARDVAPARRIRHIARPVLAAVGQLLRPFAPSLARSARAGVVMDQAHLGFDPGPSLAAYPWLPCTRVLASDAGLTGRPAN